MKIAIYTLGCKVNQYETQALEAEAVRRGHFLVPYDGMADAYIINTCTVTAVSDHKSRQAIRRAQKRNPAALVAVCGCYAQTDPDSVAALGVDFVAGSADRMGFLDEVERLWMRRVDGATASAPRSVDDVMARRDFEFLPAGGLEGRTRAMLKVEDGCVNFCTYCIIPFARGPIRSLPLECAAAETGRLARDGFRELVLTGIELSSWGADLTTGATLIDLVEAVCRSAEGMRIRLGSLEPRTITTAFCARAAALENLCPHFHLSLQSGCDTVLQRMNRKYDTARYLQSVTELRRAFPLCAITTDVIVGFPGESDAEFETTLRFLEQCRFSALHIFPYSRRPGTPADAMAGQVPHAVKEQRAKIAGALAQRAEETALQSLVGTVQQVLFETDLAGVFRGHAENYAELFVPGVALHNQVRPVTVTALSQGKLLGALLENHP